MFMKTSVCILAAIVLISALRMLPIFRRSPFWGRRKMSEHELLNIFGGNPKAMEALSLVAKCYGLPVGVLRPDDTFSEKGALYRMDDWQQGAGLEKLDAIVREMGLEGEHPDWTVADFVAWYVDNVSEGPVTMKPFGEPFGDRPRMP